MSRIPSLEGAMLALENGSQRVQSRVNVDTKALDVTFWGE